MRWRQEDSKFEASLAELKQNTNKRTEGVARVVEHLPSKCQALGLMAVGGVQGCLQVTIC
jgi:hypothetical protein